MSKLSKLYYFDGRGQVKARISDEVLAIAYLNPFDQKLSIIEEPTKNLSFPDTVVPTVIVELKERLEARRKSCETTALNFIRTCSLGPAEKPVEGIDEESDEDSDEESQCSLAVINYELSRFKKLGRRMRNKIYEDDAEKKLSESNRNGEDYENFWNKKKGMMPTLSSIYTKILTIPASSSIVESSFLYLKTVQAGRSQLTPNHCDDLLQLFFDKKIGET